MKYFPKLLINKIKILYLSILGIVFAVFLVLSFLNIALKKQVSVSNVYLNPLTFTPQNYPEVINKYTPIISAQGAVVIDKASQVPLYEKNPNK
mgnify:CR=1 FL=1